jgi:hypothetical protein
MSGMGHKQQLIMFMTGAGGSGKTRVINAVLMYAKGFCKELQYVFDKRMIVVTALTGVAATLINGETMHSAAKLFNAKITAEHIMEWANTRLVIIDKILFATSADLLKLNEKLSREALTSEGDQPSKVRKFARCVHGRFFTTATGEWPSFVFRN